MKRITYRIIIVFVFIVGGIVHAKNEPELVTEAVTRNFCFQDNNHLWDFSYASYNPHGCPTVSADSIQSASTWSVDVIAAQDSICYGSAADIMIELIGISMFMIEWHSNPPGFEFSDPYIYPTPLEDTWFIAEVTAAESVQSDSVLITVIPYPEPVFNAFADTNNTTTAPFQLTATPEGGVWSGCTEDGWIYPAEETLGWNNFSYTAQNEPGCANTIYDSVFIYQEGQWSIYMDYTYDSICTGHSTALWVVIVGVGDYEVQWTSEPVGFLSTEMSLAVSPEDNTHYFVEVTDGISTLQDSLMVYVIPYLEPVIGAHPDTMYYRDPSINLTTNISGGVWFGWITHEGVFDPNAGPMGWRWFTYTVRNILGCRTTVKDSIFVAAPLGIEDISCPKALITPNPNSGAFTLIFPDEGNDIVRLTLFSLKGVILYQREEYMENGKIPCSINGLSPGLYILKSEYNSQVLSTKLVIGR